MIDCDIINNYIINNHHNHHNHHNRYDNRYDNHNHHSRYDNHHNSIVYSITIDIIIDANWQYQTQ